LHFIKYTKKYFTFLWLLYILPRLATQDSHRYGGIVR